MEPDFAIKMLGGLLEQGPLVGLLFYFYREAKIEAKARNDQAILDQKDKEKQIKELYDELLAKQEGYLSKTFETIASNTSAINGLKDVITVKNNG